jgi:cell division protein FtsQ
MPRVTAADRKAPASRTLVRAPRSLNDRPSRWRLLLRRQRYLAWPAAYAAGALITVLVVALLVRSAAPERRLAGWRESLGSLVPMHVQQVVIEGRANTPDPVLRAALGVIPGQPILAFSVADARARIETLSWVDHATVERRLPGTIVVQLEERRPFAIWQNQGRFVLIDRAGQIVANQDVAAFRQLPLVVGAGAPEHAAALLDDLAAQPALQSRVTAAVRVGERRWNLVLNNGLSVLLPEGQARAALVRLMELQASQALLDRPLQTVDMRLPDRLVLRPRPDVPLPGQAVIPPVPAKRPT